MDGRVGSDRERARVKADRSRLRELAKGVGGSFPILVALAAFTASMDSISQWGARHDHAWASFQSLLVILFWSSAIALFGLVASVIFFWRQSRWVAYGVLLSFGAIVVLGAGLFLLLLSGIPGHD